MNVIVTILAAILAGAAFGTAVSLREDGLHGYAAFWFVLAALNAAYVADKLIGVAL
jgi:hypothetical protein